MGICSSISYQANITQLSSFKWIDITSAQGFTIAVKSDGTLWFWGKFGFNGRQLWKTDGTTNGAQLVKIFTNGNNGGCKAPHDNLLYFAKSSSPSVQELWKTDGTEINTVLVHQFDSIGIMKEINCNLYISADGNLNWNIRNVELWSDTSSCAQANVYDMLNPSSIRIFPNPTSDVLNVLLPNSPNLGNYRIADQWGKIVMNDAFESNETFLNLSDLAQGVYFLSVEGINEVKRIIKY